MFEESVEKRVGELKYKAYNVSFKNNIGKYHIIRLSKRIDAQNGTQ